MNLKGNANGTLTERALCSVIDRNEHPALCVQVLYTTLADALPDACF